MARYSYSVYVRSPGVCVDIEMAKCAYCAHWHHALRVCECLWLAPSAEEGDNGDNSRQRENVSN
jgi:hypothetical protein